MCAYIKKTKIRILIQPTNYCIIFVCHFGSYYTQYITHKFMNRTLIFLFLAALPCFSCSGRMPNPALQGLTLSENVLYFDTDALTGKLWVLCSYRWTVSAPDFVQLSQTAGGAGVDYIYVDISIPPATLAGRSLGELLGQLTFTSSQGEEKTVRLIYGTPIPLINGNIDSWQNGGSRNGDAE
jgi:hypothetical protein